MAPTQVAAGHYAGRQYDTRERLHSYAEQIHETLALAPGRVVEVGVGNGFVTRALRGYGLEVLTVDFDPALQPDVVASVDSLPLPDGDADVVVCFEVLEHLPFDRFGLCLRELARVSRGPVLVSVPDCRSALRLELARGWSRVRRWGGVYSNVPPRPAPAHVFDGQHYWEIGKAETPERRVLASIEEAGLDVVRHHRLYSHPYHHFFHLRNRAPR